MYLTLYNMSAYLLALCILSLIIIIIKSSTYSETSSYQEENTGTDLPTVFEEIEKIYLNSMPVNTVKKEDPLCILSNGQKITLCESIFNLNHYKNYIKISINKSATYVQKLSCEEQDITFTYTISSNNKNIKLKQNMYSCPGRHDTVRTSIIQDEYYDAFFISSGPTKNSVMVYAQLYDEPTSILIIYDYIKNIKLTELQNTVVKEKDVTNELKLQKVLFTTNTYRLVENNYLRNAKYFSKNDSICDLESGKKISLCNIILDQFINKYFFEITLNKAAAYVYHMICITRPIHKVSSEFNVLLSEKQTLLPCFGRHYSRVTDSNFLKDDYSTAVYLSSGTKRNSFYAYIRVIGNSNRIFSLVGMIENINIRILKSTAITLQDVKLESELTYMEVVKITESQEKNYYNNKFMEPEITIKITEESGTAAGRISKETKNGKNITKWEKRKFSLQIQKLIERMELLIITTRIIRDEITNEIKKKQTKKKKKSKK